MNDINCNTISKVQNVVSCIWVLRTLAYCICAPVCVHLCSSVCTFHKAQITNSTEHSPSWEADRSSASQEIPRTSWNTDVHYRTHKSWLPIPILNQMNPIHTPYTTTEKSILMLFSHLRLGLPSRLFPSLSPTRTLYSLFLSEVCATCPAHRILHNLITRIIFGEEYISLSSSLCSLLQFRVTSSVLSPDIFLGTLFPNTHRICSPSMWRTKFPIH